MTPDRVHALDALIWIAVIAPFTIAFIVASLRECRRDLYWDDILLVFFSALAFGSAAWTILYGITYLITFVITGVS